MSYSNSSTNVSGEKKEKIVLNYLSKKYNVKRYINDYYIDEWGQEKYNQNYIHNGKTYKCPDLYLLETGSGNNIVLRIEVKGFREVNKTAFSKAETVLIEEYKFDSYVDLMMAEEIESCVVFVIGNENSGDLYFYWETLSNLLNIKHKEGWEFGTNCLFWRTQDLKFGLDGFLGYIDEYMENYW